MGGTLRADVVDTSLTVQGGNDSVRATAAVRQGYLDHVAAALWPDAEEVLALPSHRDAGVVLVVEPRRAESITVRWLGASDRARTMRLRDDLRQEQRADASQWLGSATLTRRYGDGARVRLTPFCTQRTERTLADYGVVATRLHTEVLGYGVRGEYAWSGPRFDVQVGFDGRAERASLARSGSLTLPAREGDIALFGVAPVDTYANDRWRATTVAAAPYASLGVRFRKVTLAGGFRLETYLTSDSRAVPKVRGVPARGVERLDILPEPRIRLETRPHERLRVEARLGLVHQPARPTDRSAVFGTPNLAPARALHAVLGLTADLPFAVTLGSALFLRRASSLAVRSSGRPALAEALVARGHGLSYGASMTVERDVARGAVLSGSYTVSRSLRTEPNGRERAFDGDQPHVLTLLGGYRVERGLVSTRFRVASGRPRTSVVGTYEDVTSGTAQPLFGRHNAARVPTFVQLDLHGEVVLVPTRPNLTLFGDVMNVTARRNVEQVAYTPDFRTRRDVRSLPLLALVGLQVTL